MLQMAWIWHIFGKVFQTHASVMHNRSVCYSGVIGGSDSLGGNGNTKNPFLFVLLFCDTIFDFCSNLLIVGWAVRIGQ